MISIIRSTRKIWLTRGIEPRTFGLISIESIGSRALHGANFGDPIQPAPFAQTHFHPFPGFQGKFSPNPLRFHVYEFYINCLLNAKKNSLSFHTNKELKHQDSINMFDRYNGYQMTKSWTLQYWMSNCKFCCLLQLYLWNLKIMINQS